MLPNDGSRGRSRFPKPSRCLVALIPLLRGACDRPQDSVCKALDEGVPVAAVDILLPVIDEPDPGAGPAEALSVPGELMITISSANESFRRDAAALLSHPGRDEVNILSLSAGGSWGAFGAGFMAGWSNRSNDQRPEFHIVTGVSTGAIMAPLVFLGQDFDNTLKEVYTTIANDDVFTSRFLPTLLFSDSLYCTTPIRKRVESIVTDNNLVERVAQEWERDRRLLGVLAVNLYSGQSLILNLSAISRSDQFDRERIDRSVDALMASAEIPIGFEPVFIDGDMYVNGGAWQHVFVGAEIAAASLCAGASLSEEAQTGRLSIR